MTVSRLQNLAATTFSAHDTLPGRSQARLDSKSAGAVPTRPHREDLGFIPENRDSNDRRRGHDGRHRRVRTSPGTAGVGPPTMAIPAGSPHLEVPPCGSPAPVGSAATHQTKRGTSSSRMRRLPRSSPSRISMMSCTTRSATFAGPTTKTCFAPAVKPAKSGFSAAANRSSQPIRFPTTRARALSDAISSALRPAFTIESLSLLAAETPRPGTPIRPYCVTVRAYCPAVTSVEP